MIEAASSGAGLLLSEPLDAAHYLIDSPDGQIAVYVAGAVEAEPLLLIHSVNAAATAFELRPLFDHFRASRRVYAFDLPGFGKSERSDRTYSVRMMTDAVHTVANHIRSQSDNMAIDGLALSLGCEFLGRAACEAPEAYRSLAFISPTGFDTPIRNKSPGNRGKPWLLKLLNVSWWREAAFRLSTRRKVIRAFLEKTWGSEQIDESLLDYSCQTVRQPGAEHAPYFFISGYFFSTDILRIYEALRLPVWMCHGIRGDFVDYQHKDVVADKANWKIEIFDTGAFPQFERLDSVARSYSAYAGSLSKSAPNRQNENMDAIRF